jgi:mannose-1-phosphate guanylyltransferase
MFRQEEPWALVLAAGSGNRLRRLTTAAGGDSVPKQYCALRGGPSLLDEALERARVVAAPSRTVVVVAEQHRRWWEPALAVLPANNIVVQPANRGTANGVLLPLLHIVERDPGARLLILPSDHHVFEAAVLARSLRHAMEQLQWRFGETLLLGFRPEEADPQLGYILPGATDGRGALQVQRFVEKPSESVARQLLTQGGLWNAFILASSAPALLSLFRSQVPGIVRELRAAVQGDLQSGGTAAVARLYAQLPTIDFCGHILQGREEVLRVLPVPSCGWSDLGTPERVAKVLRQAAAPERGFPTCRLPAVMNLADQQVKLAGFAP